MRSSSSNIVKKNDDADIKSLPVVPILPGKTRGTLTVEEMIELVKSVELEDDLRKLLKN